jgi:hypothetical protein
MRRHLIKPSELWADVIMSCPVDNFSLFENYQTVTKDDEGIT